MRLRRGGCQIEFLVNFQVKAHLVAPILMGDELWGLLAAHHCANPRQWQDYEIELIRQVAIQAGVAIQQADLFEQVQKEALRIQTLFNTSSFCQRDECPARVYRNVAALLSGSRTYWRSCEI